MLFHNLHPPDEVRVFEIPEVDVRVWDDTTLVFDIPFGDRRSVTGVGAVLPASARNTVVKKCELVSPVTPSLMK